MNRVLAVTLAVLLLPVQAATASRFSDSDYIASVRFPEQAVEALRLSAEKRFVRRLATPLSKLGGRIADPDRFAAMLPAGLTDPSLAYLRAGLTELYRESFSDADLEVIATFLRTDTAEMLRAFEWERFRANGSKASYEETPKLVPKDCLDGLGILTPEETAICRTFLANPAADVMRHRALEAKMAVLVLKSIWLVDSIPIELNAPYLVEILEADGVVIFPNRVARRNVIDQLRRQN